MFIWAAMTQKRLRVGIFGVGRMGLVHLENLTRRALAGEVALVAIGDRFAPALGTAQDRLAQWAAPDWTAQVAAFESPEAMARHAALDACVVASRTQDHARDCLCLAGQGIRVLVEKPLAGSVAEAASLCVALPAASHALVQVAFQRHYDPAAQAAAQWVAEGRIGALQQSHHVLQDKNGRPHSVPLNNMAMAVVLRQVGKHASRVFTYQGEPIGQANTRAWSNALARAGIENFRWLLYWRSFYCNIMKPPHYGLRLF